MAFKTLHVQGNVTIFAWLGDIPDGLRQNPNVAAISEPAPMRIADIPDAVYAAGEAMAAWAPCRGCGCTETDPCDPPCHWVQPELCSACAPADAETHGLMEALGAAVDRARHPLPPTTPG